VSLASRDRIPEQVGGLVDHLFRRTAARMVAVLTRALGASRLDLAEEVVQDAMLRALETWPFRGVPENPEGWLMRVARNRAIDVLRRESALESSVVLAFDPAPGQAREAPLSTVDCQLPTDGDSELSMVLMCCHPDIPRESRVALTLKTVGGFGVREIARAFLVREDAIAQRLVRAKRRIRERNITLEVPGPDAIDERMDSVLDVLYLMFNEGYETAGGDDLTRVELCAEAIRLAGLLAAHPASRRPELHALLALMLFQASRLRARTAADGGLLLLSEQDRSLWDRAFIDAGLAHLERSAEGDRLTGFHLEAGIAACHVAAPSYEDTDWQRILALYDALLDRSGSPIVALNRAVAVGMLEGPAAALRVIEPIAQHDALERYFLLPATRGELLQQLGENAAAADEYRRAISLPCSEPERIFLLRRLAACHGVAPQSQP
jgi:RNA polymerase sigma-70 factor (ECF subfamily)